ncbi:MAG: response regulator transcription factor [Thiohalomonadales bacterium]|nr:response regulator transcription factor [Thiohalomonadales bacterium]
MNIAVVDDDQDVASLLCLWLEEEGYTCMSFLDGQTFTRQVGNEQFDAVLLDWMMPEVDGEQVLAWLRGKQDWDTPVIFVTSRTTEDDMVRILNEGADDYITKPVSRRELLARIAAVTRRSNKRYAQEILEIGPYQIDPQSHSLRVEGKAVKLTDKEFELASYIFNHIGRLLSRNQILASVWGYESDVNTRTVDTHISRIRKKLQLTPENGWRLSSIYHQGYRLERLASEDLSFQKVSHS